MRKTLIETMPRQFIAGITYDDGHGSFEVHSHIRTTFKKLETDFRAPRLRYFFLRNNNHASVKTCGRDFKLQTCRDSIWIPVSNPEAQAHRACKKFKHTSEWLSLNGVGW